MRRISARAIVLGLSLFFSFLSSGVLYGWPALQTALLRNDVYAPLCEAQNNASPCSAQLTALNGVFTIGSTANTLLAMLLGLLLDRWGPRVTVGLSSGMVTVGYALLSAQSPTFNALPVAFVCLASGIGIHISLLHQAVLWGRHSGTVVSALTAAFAGSSFVFPALVAAMPTASLSTMMQFMAVLQAVAAVASTWLMPKSSARPGQRMILRYGHAVLVDAKDLEDGRSSAETDLLPSSDDSDDDVTSPKQSFRFYSALHASARAQLTSSTFIWHVVTQALLVLRLLSYMGSVNLLLARKSSDTAAAQSYASIFNVCASLSFLWIPLAGSLVRRGFAKMLTVTTALAVAYGLLTALPSLPSQLLGFFCWSAARQTLFAYFYAYLGAAFGFGRVGTLNGVASLFIAAAQTLQQPLFVWTETALRGNVVWSQQLQSLALLPIFIRAYFLHRAENEALPPQKPAATSQQASAATTETGDEGTHLESVEMALRE
eukprot:PLAT4365.1.p1 GENE.PLAT4365.1~~PLAT4365.1.p1  ORF type:complete len:489 (-),score=147.85 PLAT4365.1:1246-2712(-)